MKLQLLTAVAVTALMAMPSLASADEQGWYVRGNVGYGNMTDMDITGDLTGDVEAESNAAISVGVGYAFGNDWRVELDGTQLWNDLGALSQWANTSASMRTTNVMLNAIYDFDDFGAWRPYIGAGLGIVRANLSANAHAFPGGNPAAAPVNNPGCVNFNSCAINETDAAVAWQVIAGVGYDLTESLVWDTQYRYIDNGGLDYVGAGRNLTAGVLGNATTINSAVDGSGAHVLMTGLRYKFGAKAAPAPTLYSCWNGSQVENLSACPAEPPKVVWVDCWDGSQVESGNACPVQITCWDGSIVSDAASCPAQPTITCWDGSLAYNTASCPVESYEYSLCANAYSQEIIYYDFDKPQSAETQGKIQRVLDAAKHCAVGNVNVVGHTDTSGSAAYNLGLSKRRAADVSKELVRQGISSDMVTSEGKGETQLFLETGDGVREPLNRRTEVIVNLSRTGVVN